MQDRKPVIAKEEARQQAVETTLDISTWQGSNSAVSSNSDSSSPKNPDRKARTKPVWAEGLRRMYDEVVDEQLPDDFVDLLKKLDQNSAGN